MLAAQPNVTPKCAPSDSAATSTKKHTPYRLFRYSVPPACWEDRSIGIMGAYLSVGQAISVQCQALWLSAYFDESLPMQCDPSQRKSVPQIEYETELALRFHRLRTPAGNGNRFGDFTFDTIPFMDLFLNDLGINPHRKTTWRKHWTEPHRPRDYRGLVDEWATMQQARQGEARQDRKSLPTKES